MMNNNMTILCFFVLVNFCFAAEPEYQPQLEPASNEGELAISSFRLPENMKLELVAAEPDVANPVAFAFDEQGRILVCETFRQKKGVEDNRSHLGWLLDDLQANTVEDRRQYMLKHHPEFLKAWTAEHDRLRLLTDTNGDGKYDRAEVFADGFNDFVSGTGAGVLAFNGMIYYTCIPRLWMLQDDDGDNFAESRQVLQDGFGVRFAFRGHDMHGLVLGPDGRIYFSIGDRGYNLITADGRLLKRPDTGAVFRCERDGTNLEEYAYGLRNPQELAFDDHGHLFTGDNNSDSGDQARWVYVAEGSDSGWRMYYQYLQDRGPWNRERMWYPFQADEETARLQPAFILPPVANLGDGPSGLVAYPGVGLSERYQGHFFLADFRGQAANSGIRAFMNQPKGAGFELVDSHEYLWNTLVTDVDFGYDGRLYFSDWINGWDGLQKGRIYRQQPNNEEYRQAGDEVAERFRNGFQEQSAQQLLSLLQHGDRRVRLRAQIELAERNAVDLLIETVQDSPSQWARLHALWGLWEIGRKAENKQFLEQLLPLFDDEDPFMVAQLCRVLGDCRFQPAGQKLISAMKSSQPRITYHAAIAIGKLGLPVAIPYLQLIAETRCEQDPVLRHAVMMALTGVGRYQRQHAGHVNLIHKKLNSRRPMARLVTVVAQRRLRDPTIDRFLSDHDIRVVEEAARAIHDEQIMAAYPQLCIWEQYEQLSDALARRVINVNYLLAGQEQADRLITIAADDELGLSWREQALDALLNWERGSDLDAVTGEFHPRKPQQAPYLAEVIAPHITKLLTGPESIQRKAVELASLVKLKSLVPQLQEYVQQPGSSTELRVAALKAIDLIAPSEATTVVKKMLSVDNLALRMEARRIFVQRRPQEAVEVLRVAMMKGKIPEQQAAIRLLKQLPAADRDRGLQELMSQLLEGKLPAAIHLDVLQAIQSSSDADLLQLVERYEQQRNQDDPLSAYLECLEGGDVSQGRNLFFGNAAASCRRCHVVNGQGGGVGPDLSSIAAKNDRRYLLEAIVDPNAKIAKGFETVLIVTIEGKIVSGIIKEETDQEVVLVKPLGEIVRVPLDEIEDRAPGKSGMPDDFGKKMTKAEIRNLVAYLASLTRNKQPKGEGHQE